MIDPKLKAEIDALSVYELLRDHRFLPSGHPKYQGEQGLYRIQRLKELSEADPAAYTAASRNL